MTSRRHSWTLFQKDKVTGELRFIDGESFLDGLDKTKISYIIFQGEVCPTTNRYHLQGFIVWTTPVRIRQGCRRLGGHAHVEATIRTDKENEDYCSKSDSRRDGPWRWGSYPRQGARTDLSAIHELVTGGASRRTIIDAHWGSFLRYHSGIESARLILSGRRKWPMEVEVYWGDTGTGKSRAAWAAAGDDAYVLAPPLTTGGAVWWQKYDNEPNIIIEEFYGWIKWCHLLQLLDRYPYQVEYKGGSCEFVGKRIWICSNSHPRDWYNWHGHMKYETLRRRIKKITHFQKALMPESESE